jgi:RNA polymerase sigma-70 factor (ECF subfamily)
MPETSAVPIAPSGGARIDLEQALVERVARRERHAHRALYSLHKETVLRITNGILRNTADAEDVAQEVWIEVWRRAEAYDPRRATVAGWLVMLAKSRAWDRRRRGQLADAVQRAAHSDAEVERVAREDDAEPADEALARGAQEAALHADVDALPKDQARAVRLHFWEGKTRAEIAAKMRADDNTVRTLLRHALASILERQKKRGAARAGWAGAAGGER